MSKVNIKSWRCLCSKIRYLSRWHLKQGEAFWNGTQWDYFSLWLPPITSSTASLCGDYVDSQVGSVSHRASASLSPSPLFISANFCAIVQWKITDMQKRNKVVVSVVKVISSDDVVSVGYRLLVPSKTNESINHGPWLTGGKMFRWRLIGFRLRCCCSTSTSSGSDDHRQSLKGLILLVAVRFYIFPLSITARNRHALYFLCLLPAGKLMDFWDG